MQAIFFTFSKRINSTKIPNDNAGTLKNVVLKEGTSINNPTLKLTSPNLSYNYVKFAGNYYFIRDIVLGNNNIYEVQCSIDVLGTFRGDILGYSAFIKRSASHYNLNLNDSLIASGQEIVQDVETGTIIHNDLNGAGSFALRTASSDGIRTYWLSYIQLYAALDYIFTQQNIADVMSDAFVNFFVKCEDYILSLMYFKCYLRNSISSSVKFGFFDTEINAECVNPLDPVGNYTKDIPMPARYYNDFRDFSNLYTQATINLAGYGLYNIDAIYLQKQISVTYGVDYLTGACTIRIFNADGTIARLKGMLGANIQLAGVGSSGGGLAGSVLEAGAGAISGNPLLLAKGALDLSQTIMQPPVNVIGNQDSIAHILQNPASVGIHVRRMNSAGIPIIEKGRPYCQQNVIGNLSGYCECLNASVPTNADEAMKEEINRTLNSGFYIE